MNATFCELRDKEVISVKDGRRLGFISDLEIVLCTGRVNCIILPPSGSCLALFSKKGKIVIPWNAIEKIGDDIILVKYCELPEIKEKRH